ncbi:hypothetical protein ACIP4V_02620 [Streptomyces albidoflavus]
MLLETSSRAVFYRTPELKNSEQRLPAKLTYSTPVLRYVVQELPSGANGMAAGFAYVQTENGSVVALQGPTGKFLGTVESGPRGWLNRFRLEKAARKRARSEREEIKKNEKAAEIAAQILEENRNAQ